LQVCALATSLPASGQRPPGRPRRCASEGFLGCLLVALGDKPVEFVVDVLHLFAGDAVRLLDAGHAEDELADLPAVGATLATGEYARARGARGECSKVQFDQRLLR
jgi:hypothetical protein